MKDNILAKAKNTENDLRFLIAELLKKSGIQCPDWQFSPNRAKEAIEKGYVHPESQIAELAKLTTEIKLTADVLKFNEAKDEKTELEKLAEITKRANEKIQIIYSSQIFMKDAKRILSP